MPSLQISSPPTHCIPPPVLCRCQVLDLTQFPSDDPAITRSQAVANVRAAMANGNTVALMYASSIHGSLYDLLNQVRHRAWCEQDGMRACTFCLLNCWTCSLVPFLLPALHSTGQERCHFLLCQRGCGHLQSSLPGGPSFPAAGPPASHRRCASSLLQQV